jgi:hypothetical protein
MSTSLEVTFNSGAIIRDICLLHKSGNKFDIRARRWYPIQKAYEFLPPLA